MRGFISKKELVRYHKIKEKEYTKQSKRYIQKRNQNNNVSTSLFQNYSKFFYNKFIHILDETDFVDKALIKKNVHAPKNLTFHDNFEETIIFLKEITSSLYYSPHNVQINFTKCKKTSISPLQTLQIFLIEFEEFKSRYNLKATKYYLDKKVTIRLSKTKKVNKLLYSLELVPYIQHGDAEETDRFFSLDLKIGTKSRKSYYENRKGEICSNVSNFIDESMGAIKYGLNERGKSRLHLLIAEILNNAEDHGAYNRWYVNGVSFKEEENRSTIVELNLCIINFGSSIFEGLENTKSDNLEIYSKLEQQYHTHSKIIKESEFFKKFSRQSLFTLYALQGGISRLKFTDGSRGTGTMTFIRSFMELGGLGDENPKYIPYLNIFSGNISLTCDNKYKPILNDNVWVLPLNKEQSLTSLPDHNYIKYYKENFPGTILQIKLFLNQDYFDKKINGKQ